LTAGWIADAFDCILAHSKWRRHIAWLSKRIVIAEILGWALLIRIKQAEINKPDAAR
jgi:hypothetical protein